MIYLFIYLIGAMITFNWVKSHGFFSSSYLIVPIVIFIVYVVFWFLAIPACAGIVVWKFFHKEKKHEKV
jgi:hypothetical protein